MSTKIKKIVFGDNEFSALIKGSGEPILCLSGFGCDHYNFLWLELAGKMIMLDNRGMGQSQNNLENYDLETLAKDAHEYMLGLGYKSYHVCGISMGGMIAVECALQFPDSVKTLTLLCTTSGGDRFDALPKLTEEDLINFYSLPINQSAPIAVKATSCVEEKWDAIIKLRKAHPAKLEEVLKQKRAVDQYLKSTKALEEIKCPTYILSGANDRYVSPKNSKTLNQKISSSSLAFIENSDHLFFLERPQLVSRYINNFLQGEAFYDLAQ